MQDPVKSLTADNIRKLIKDRNDRELCFLLLADVIGNGAFSNLAIKRADKEAQAQGVSLNFVRAMFYGTLTYLYSIDQMVRMITRKDMEDLDLVTSVLIRMSFWQMAFADPGIPSYAILSSAVDIAKRYNPKASGLVNALLRKIDSADKALLDMDRYNPNIKTSMKPELFGILKKSYGQEKAVSIGKALLAPSPVTLRFDPHKISGEDLLEDLAGSGITATSGNFMPCAVTIKGSLSGIENLRAYKEGWISVQNEAAQLASFVADPKPQDRILDCCSAPGGKSCHMAEIARDMCHIDSLDINGSRLELVRMNAARLGLSSVHTAVCDARDMSSIEDSSYDIVLLDVPCSGLGLMGRKPDIRMNMTYEKVLDIVKVQREILEQACSKVKPGGALIYCTCTLDSMENEEQVKAFLEEHKEFIAVPIDRYIPEELNVNPERIESFGLGYVTLFPDTDKVDGFFISRMERK